MKKIVREYVRSCKVCQRNKRETVAPLGLLQPLPIPNQIWEDLAMDIIDGLPVSYNKNSIMVVVDRLSKYIHLFPLTHPYTASSVAQVFMEGVCKLYGVPKSIVSDRDPSFTSLFWKELFKLQGTYLLYSSAYHPQSDGKTEITNKCVEAYLRCFCSHKPGQWSKHLG